MKVIIFKKKHLIFGLIILTLIILGFVLLNKGVNFETFSEKNNNKTEQKSEKKDEKKRVEIKAITLDEATNMYANSEDVIIIDLRSAEDYDENKIDGAINISSESIKDYKNTLSKDKTLILYDADMSVSPMIAKELIEEGFTVYILRGGISEYMSY